MASVLHSFSIWLPRTQTWSYNQIRYLPSAIDSAVVAEETTNLGEFGWGKLHSPQIDAPLRRLWWRILRRARLRSYTDYMRATTRRLRPDVVHSHFGNVGWQDLSAVDAVSAKHVVTFYGADVSYLPRQDPSWYDRYRDLFSSVDRVLCEGPHMAKEVEGLGCPASTISVHHLGVAVDEIEFQNRSIGDGDTLKILMAASFVEKKGLPFGLDAIGMIRDSVSVELTIIGDAIDDARGMGQKNRVLEAVERNGLEPVTRLLGYCSHAEFFEEAYKHHVFLAPSVTASDGDTEGGAPVGMIEAAATGMLVVSSVHCDIPEVILDGVSGLLAPERDTGALASHLEWLARNRDRWPVMARAGRDRIEREFDARVQARRLASIYEELCRPGRN